MGAAEALRYAFATEWLDPTSDVVWHYQLLFYPDSQEVEMFDVKARRTFLKRSFCETLALDQLYPGNSVLVYGRQLHLKDYADQFTRKVLEHQLERTCLVLHAAALQNLGDCLKAVEKQLFTVQKVIMCQLQPRQAVELWPSQSPAWHRSVVQGPVVALQLLAEDAIAKGRLVEGQLAGKDVIAADRGSAVAAQVEFFFGAEPQVTPSWLGQGTSLCIIKPHCLLQGHAGAALAHLQRSFAITGLRSLVLEAAHAGDFLEVYRGVVPGGELAATLKELISGPLLAVEVAPYGDDETDVVEALRKVCGPHDPLAARELRPQSLRARFGITKAENGVHCTDLQEDAPLELGFCFALC